VSQEFDLAVHYTLKGEHDRAVRLFRQILEVEPHNAGAWSYLGICYAHLGKGPEAEDALSHAIDLAPQNSESWFHLGVARSLRHQWRDAAGAYRRAVALRPTDMVAWHRLGVALAESGDESGAVVAFERALVLSRETGEAPLENPVPSHGADVHDAEASEPEGAREAKSWLDLALSLLSLGEEEAAISAYERAFTLEPERARRSLFRPMLELMTAAAGGPLEETTVPPPSPRPPGRPTPRPIDDRPEVR
jgi:superkiller protein 3